jgi:hypothetical protein
MKKILVFLLICFTGLGLWADEPQLAFRLLDEYIREKEEFAESKIGPMISLTLGTGLAVAGTTFLIADEYNDFQIEFEGEIMDKQTKNIIGYSMIGGGLLTMGVSTGLLFADAPDYRAEYSEIFGEEDPVVQEALAAAALYRLSDEARTERIREGIFNLSIPIAVNTIAIIINVSEGEPWYSDLTEISLSQINMIVSGIYNLAFHVTDEERLYEEYEIAMDAFYGSQRKSD